MGDCWHASLRLNPETAVLKCYECEFREEAEARRKRGEAHYYVYSFTRDGRYVYERTCGTEHAAQEWVAKLGRGALYVVNHIIKGAFY